MGSLLGLLGIGGGSGGGLSGSGGSAGPAYSGVTFAPVVVNSIATPTGNVPGFSLGAAGLSVTGSSNSKLWLLLAGAAVAVWFFFIRK